MRGPQNFERKVEEMKPSKSDINWVIMDYLVREGYPAAAEKFAQEANFYKTPDIEEITERVRIRDAIHSGRVDEAIDLINEIHPDILDDNGPLHFELLQLQLIEIIRPILAKPSSQQIPAQDFVPAIEFATDQLAPRAPTDQKYQTALERTMALMIFPPEKMTAEFKELLDLKLREKVASDTNKAILNIHAERSEAKIRQLVRARAWAEGQAREAKIDIPPYIPIGLDADEMNGIGGADGDAVIT